MMNGNMKKAIRSCLVCSHLFGEVLHHQRFALPENHPLPEAYDVVACPSCGFVYADTPAQQADYDRYYNEFSKYEDTTLASGGGASELDARRLKKTASDIRGFLPDTNASILDIGCANGGLLAALKNEGYSHLTGLDPSRSCVEHVERMGFRSLWGGLFCDSAISPTEQFDCVILSHVLEHVCALPAAVENILRRLKNGGMIYIEVPDASRYGDYPIVPYYYFDCEHINHFDETVLKNLFIPCGCEYVAHGQKELVVAGNRLYPAVYVVFRKTDAGNTAYRTACQGAVRESVRDHLRQSQQARAHEVFEEFAKTQQPIVIWGVGSHALRLMGNTALGKCNIVAFVDKDKKKQGTRMGAVVIHDPNYLYHFSGTVVVCAALASDDIIKEIKNMGIPCPVVSANERPGSQHIL